MMGYARSVPNKWKDLKGRFFVPGLPNAGALFRHQLPSANFEESTTSYDT